MHSATLCERSIQLQPVPASCDYTPLEPVERCRFDYTHHGHPSVWITRAQVYLLSQGSLTGPPPFSGDTVDNCDRRCAALIAHVENAPRHKSQTQRLKKTWPDFVEMIELITVIERILLVQDLDHPLMRLRRIRR